MTQREDRPPARPPGPAAEPESSRLITASNDGQPPQLPRGEIGRRPRNLTTPPPDPAEALYYEGMAAYQHRNWEEALARFTRLKELQPSRPGLDALLDEVRWFLQLQATAPGAETVTRREAAPTEGREANAIIPRSRLGIRNWQSWGLILLGVIGVTALLLIALQGRLPWTNAAEREAQELYNRGQARLTVGDYEGAQAAFQKLLEISPDDPEARLGLSRAERQQTLAQGYAAAEAAIATEDWDTATAELAAILAIDSSYADAQVKADFVAQRRRLAGLYDDGSRLYDLGQWQDAISQFEKIRELDSSYRTEAVAEFLFICYLNAGQTLIADANGVVAPVQMAIEYFSRALAIHPRNRPAADARRLGNLYLDATRSLAAGNIADAQARLEVLLAETPTYADGAAARQLYDLLVQQAQAAVQADDIPAAVALYEQAQTLAVSDQTAASQGKAFALSITPTATPRPTNTPRPTSTVGPTSPPITPTPYAILRTGVLNVRSGPSTAYPVLGQVRTADPLVITGRNAESSWLRVCCVAGQAGWIAAGLVEVQGALAGLPIVAPPPVTGATPRPQAPASQVVCVSGQVRNTAGAGPLAGWTIVLQAASGASQSQRTDGNGVYRFAGLTPGIYTVAETPEIGWRAVSPQANTITLSAAADCQIVDFWNERSEPPPSPPPPTPSPPPPSPTPYR